MIVELAIDDFLCGLDDGFADLGVQPAQRHIGAGRGLLDDAERTNDRRGLLFPADLEVSERTLCLCAPVTVACNVDRAKCVGFCACGCHQSCLSCVSSGKPALRFSFARGPTYKAIAQS